jgi:hypothetical protein
MAHPPQSPQVQAWCKTFAEIRAAGNDLDKDSLLNHMRTLKAHVLSFAEYSRLFPVAKTGSLLPFNIEHIQLLLSVAHDGFSFVGNRKFLLDTMQAHLHKNGALEEVVASLDSAGGFAGSAGAASAEADGGQLDLEALTTAAAKTALSALKTQITSSVPASASASAETDASSGGGDAQSDGVARIYPPAVDSLCQDHTEKNLFSSQRIFGPGDISVLLPADTVVVGEGMFEMPNISLKDSGADRIVATVFNACPGAGFARGLVKLHLTRVRYFTSQTAGTIAQIEGTLIGGANSAPAVSTTTAEQVNDTASHLSNNRVYSFSIPKLNGKAGNQTIYAIRVPRDSLANFVKVNLTTLSDKRLTAIVGGSSSLLLGDAADTKSGLVTTKNNGDGTNACMAISASDALISLHPLLVPRVGSREALSTRVLGALQEYACNSGRILSELLSMLPDILVSKPTFSWSLLDSRARRVVAEVIRRAHVLGATADLVAGKRAAVERALSALLPNAADRAPLADTDELLKQSDTIAFLEYVCSRIAEPAPGQAVAPKVDLMAAVRAVNELYHRFDSGRPVGRQGVELMADMLRRAGIFTGMLVTDNRLSVQIWSLSRTRTNTFASGLPLVLFRYYSSREHYEFISEWNTLSVRLATLSEQSTLNMLQSFWVCMESSAASAPALPTPPPTTESGTAGIADTGATNTAVDAAAISAAADAASAAAAKATTAAQAVKAASVTGDASAVAKAASEAEAAAKAANEAAAAAKAVAAKTAGGKGNDPPPKKKTKKGVEFAGGTKTSPKLDLSGLSGLSAQDRALASHAARVGTEHPHILSVLASKGGRGQWCIFGEYCNSDRCNRDHDTPTQKHARQRVQQRQQKQQQTTTAAHTATPPTTAKQQQQQQQEVYPWLQAVMAQSLAAAANVARTTPPTPPTPPTPTPPTLPTPPAPPASTAPAADPALLQQLMSVMAAQSTPVQSNNESRVMAFLAAMAPLAQLFAHRG